MELKKTINGVKVEIRCSDEGKFTSRANGEWLEAYTLAELLTILKRETKKTKVDVAVPAMLMNTCIELSSGFSRKLSKPTCLPIIMTGVDWRNDKIKYKSADGAVVTFARNGFGRGDESIGKPMTPDEVKEWQVLLEAKNKADKAFQEFNGKFVHRYGDPEKLVKAAQAAKTDTPVEADEEEGDEEGDPR